MILFQTFVHSNTGGIFAIPNSIYFILFFYCSRHCIFILFFTAPGTTYLYCFFTAPGTAYLYCFFATPGTVYFFVFTFLESSDFYVMFLSSGDSPDCFCGNIFHCYFFAFFQFTIVCIKYFVA